MSSSVNQMRWKHRTCRKSELYSINEFHTISVCTKTQNVPMVSTLKPANHFYDSLCVFFSSLLFMQFLLLLAFYRQTETFLQCSHQTIEFAFPFHLGVSTHKKCSFESRMKNICCRKNCA